MPVRIRLQRHGRKKRAFFRLVAADSRSQRDGRFLEHIGHYNPLTDPAQVVINEEIALKWLRRGAQPSDTAKDLLSKVGIWEKFTNEKLGIPMPTEEAEPSAPETEAAPSEDEPATAEDTESSAAVDDAESEETTPEADESS